MTADEIKANLVSEVIQYLENCEFVSDEDKERIPRLTREIDAQIINISEDADRHMALVTELAWVAGHYVVVAEAAETRTARHAAGLKLHLRESVEHKAGGSAVPPR